METLHDLKWAMIVFLIGFLIRLAGSLVKIRHWPMGDVLITLGFIICGIAVVFAIIKIVRMKKPAE